MAIEGIRYKDPELAQWPHQGRLVIFDLEYTAWEGSWQRGWAEPWEHREVVQLGAVMVDAARDFALLGSLLAFVRPALNPSLSEYFIRLTGITQATVDSQGCGFADAYDEFMKFAADADVLFSNGLDGEVLRENCFLLGIDYRLPPGRVVNIRRALASAVSKAVAIPLDSVDSGDLSMVLGMPSWRCSAKHDALADAKGIAAAMTELRMRRII